MNATQALRLTESTAAPASDTLRFERRLSQRRPLHGKVTGVSSAQGEQSHRIVAIELRDISDTGLGLVTAEAVPVGSQLLLLFPGHGAERGFDLMGRIVRCDDRGDGHYSVGVELTARIAA